MSDALAGTGQIRDEDSGRCVVVQQPAGVTVPCQLRAMYMRHIQSYCHTRSTYNMSHVYYTSRYGPTPATKFGVVVLDACGGDGAQWTARTSGTTTTYESGVEPPPTKCWLLNVVGDSPDVKQCEIAVWGFNLPCSMTVPQSNSEFTWVPDTHQLKIISSDRVAKTCPDPANCCLKATPCVSPCVLPTGWGAIFLIFIGVTSVVYAAGGIGWAVKTQGVPPSLQAHPHVGHWASLGGLVTDGAVFFKARVDAYRGQSSSYAPVGEAAPKSASDTAKAGLAEDQVEQRAEKAAEPGEGSSSDDELVE